MLYEDMFLLTFMYMHSVSSHYKNMAIQNTITKLINGKIIEMSSSTIYILLIKGQTSTWKTSTISNLKGNKTNL